MKLCRYVASVRFGSEAARRSRYATSKSTCTLTRHILAEQKNMTV
jgi:hypothetical protein